MKIELTSEQIERLKDDGYLDIDLGHGARVYYEFSSDGSFMYGEICDPSTNEKVKEKRNTFVFDRADIGKLKPTKPNDPSWYHNDPLCPTCSTYMIYKFECCPRCGQALDWRDRTE